MLSQVLTSCSGKFGDILFSLAVVKAISETEQQKVDFICMPAYRSLLPLVRKQPYIQSASEVSDWLCTGSPHGDQPWQPPKYVETGYKVIKHLTYRRHPMFDNKTLIDAIAANGQVTVQPGPWISVYSGEWQKHKPFVTYGFNAELRQEKANFIQELKLKMPEVKFISVENMDWTQVAMFLQESVAFVGCMGALHVLAHAVGKPVLIYEPNPDRREFNYPVYRYPYGIELILKLDDMSGYVRALEELLKCRS